MRESSCRRHTREDGVEVRRVATIMDSSDELVLL